MVEGAGIKASQLAVYYEIQERFSDGAKMGQARSRKHVWNMAFSRIPPKPARP